VIYVATLTHRDNAVDLFRSLFAGGKSRDAYANIVDGVSCRRRAFFEQVRLALRPLCNCEIG
jgi:hypothetical protein